MCNLTQLNYKYTGRHNGVPLFKKLICIIHVLGFDERKQLYINLAHKLKHNIKFILSHHNIIHLKKCILE